MKYDLNKEITVLPHTVTIITKLKLHKVIDDEKIK